MVCDDSKGCGGMGRKRACLRSDKKLSPGRDFIDDERVTLICDQRLSARLKRSLSMALALIELVIQSVA
jgi:hypothetical protein